MPKGKIGGLHSGIGHIMTEGSGYRFNVTMCNVNGTIKNGDMIEYEVKDGVVTVIYGRGYQKPKPTPKPVVKPKQKEDTSKNVVVDNREFLTEEK